MNAYICLRTHMHIPAVAGAPQSFFPRCHTHFPVISLHTHSTGAPNLWRWRLLGRFGLQILSDDSSNNCRGAEMDTHTGMYPLISDEKFARVCQNFTQIRAFELLKVSSSYELGFINHKHVFIYPDIQRFFLTFNFLNLEVSPAPVVSWDSKVSTGYTQELHSFLVCLLFH